MRNYHKVSEDISTPTEVLKIAVIGAGGTGSYVLQGLAKIDLAIKEIVHGSKGISVHVYDDDIISESNCVRQLYHKDEVGEYKSVVLVNNINRYYSNTWEAFPRKFYKSNNDYHLVVVCVDSMKSRREIYNILKKSDCRFPSFYIIDYGNGKDFGQVLLNHYIVNPKNKRHRLQWDLPESYLKTKDDDNEPSCSISQALNKQKMFVNPIIANLGLDLIYNLLTKPIIHDKGLFFNLENGSMKKINFNEKENHILN